MTNIQRLAHYLKDSCITNETLSFSEIKRICGLDAPTDILDGKRELLREGFSVIKVNVGERTVMFSRNA